MMVAAIGRMALDHLAGPFGVEQIGEAFRGVGGSSGFTSLVL